MKVQITESDNWRRTLEVEVPGEDVEKRFDTAYRSYSKSLNLPGFRKGRVPVSLIKKRFGKAIQGEVLQEVLQEFYREASRSEGLTPVSEATIEEVDYSAGQPLRFKASVDVKPEVEITGYRGLKTERPVFRVEETHVEEHLQALREQSATEQVVERAAELGDVLVADIQELDETGVPIIGRKQEGRTFLIGGRNANHDLDNQLVGISVGETRQVHLSYPKAHEDLDLAGQEARFQVTAKEVRARDLPELDDEFARDMGDFESLEALKEQIREDFQARADFTSRRRLEQNIVDALVRENRFDLPESMVENYLDSLVESYRREHAGHDHEIDEEAIRQESREGAIRGLKRYLILEAVARQEGIEVTEADIDAHLEGMSKRHNVEGDRIRQILGRSGQLDRIESELLERKTFDFLIEQAEVKDVEERTG